MLVSYASSIFAIRTRRAKRRELNTVSVSAHIARGIGSGYTTSSVDLIRFYDRALSANEVQALHYSNPNNPQPSSSVRVLSDQNNMANSAASTTLTASISANANYVFTASFLCHQHREFLCELPNSCPARRGIANHGLWD